VQAHILGEVGNLGTLLRVYSGTILPIFIEIGLYLTNKEQNIGWHSFLRHGVDSLNEIALVNKSSHSYEASLAIWITQCYLPPDTSEHIPL